MSSIVLLNERDEARYMYSIQSCASGLHTCSAIQQSDKKPSYFMAAFATRGNLRCRRDIVCDSRHSKQQEAS